MEEVKKETVQSNDLKLSVYEAVSQAERIIKRLEGMCIDLIQQLEIQSTNKNSDGGHPSGN